MSVTRSSDSARGVRRVATGILLVLLAVFLVTSTVPEPTFFILLIRAMAEAGMIGGLADWFAVEALFRRPLGLPIPHTALLPTNQRRAAVNISRFIDEYFLDPGQLMAEVRKVDPIKIAGEWLSKHDNAKRISKEIAWAIRKMVHAQAQQGLPAPIRVMASEAAIRAVRSGTLSDRIANLLQNSLDTEFLDEVLLRVRESVEENRPAIATLVQERSRWWISKGVDRKVAELLIEGVLSVLDEIRKHNSPKRLALAAVISTIIDRFKEEGALGELIDQSVTDYSETSAFTKAMDEMLDEVLRGLDDQLQANDEGFQRTATIALQKIGRTIERDADILETINQRLDAALMPVLVAMREPVRDYISKTIASWDSAELVSRIESEVGRDLQFIRINGAVLGATLGGVLFLISHAL